MSIPQPISCKGFIGKVIVHGNLTTTGSRVYEPAVLNLEEPLVITLDGHEITSIKKEPRLIEKSSTNIIVTWQKCLNSSHFLCILFMPASTLDLKQKWSPIGPRLLG